MRALEAGLMPLLEMPAAPELAELREPAMEWLQRVLLPMLGIRDERLNGTYEEVSAMAQVIFDEWKEECRAEGEEGKALEIALNLLRANAVPELVEAATGLPPEKVRELAAGLKKDQAD